MAKPLSLETKESRFRLPRQTLEQIKALMSDLDQDARSVVIIAIAELYGREIQNERDVFAELDELKAAVAALAPQKEGQEDDVSGTGSPSEQG